MSIIIKRPNLVLQGPKTKYISVNVGEPMDANVSIRPEIDENWDNIAKLVIGKKHYTQGTDPATGELSEEFHFDRWEVTDFKTKADMQEEKAEKLEDLEYDAKLQSLTKRLMKETAFEDVDAALSAAV